MPILDHAQLYRALVARDARLDGVFFVGVTARHLRRVVERRLGATPVELAQTRRLLTAKQLLTETELPVTSIALASGFRSVRRLNALFQERYRMPPTSLRRTARAGRAGGDGAETRGARDRSAGPDWRAGADGGAAAETVTLSLAYRPPYDWGAMLAYLALRATPGVEMVTADGRYRRTIQLHGHCGQVAIGATPGAVAGRASALRAHTLRLELQPSLLPVLVPLIARLRCLLDLDADPHAVTAQLGLDPLLAPLVARRPGLRVPGAVSGFELALRKAMGGLTPARLRAAAERWRPWRAYAAQHLWASLDDAHGITPTIHSQVQP